MAEFSLDRICAPKLSAGQATQLDAMTEDDISAGAVSDSDSRSELPRAGAHRAARRVRRVRIRAPTQPDRRRRLQYQRGPVARSEGA